MACIVEAHPQAACTGGPSREVSACHVAAVDVELKAGDEGRVVAGEVGDAGGDIFRSAQPSPSA